MKLSLLRKIVCPNTLPGLAMIALGVLYIITGSLVIVRHGTQESIVVLFTIGVIAIYIGAMWTYVVILTREK